MKTRSRKRAEVTSQLPSPTTPASSSKRKRVSLSVVSPCPGGAAAATSAFSRAAVASTATTTTTPAYVPPVIIVPMGSAMDSGQDLSAASGSKSEKSEKEEKRGQKEEERGQKEEERVRMTTMENTENEEKESEKEGDQERGNTDTTPAVGVSIEMKLVNRELIGKYDGISGISASSLEEKNKLKQIHFGLRAEGEEDRQLDSLSQLCELLSMGTEHSLSKIFSIDKFIPVLVGLLNYENNPEIMLLATRALTNLCDVLPSSCAAVVLYGAVPYFCTRLLIIEYIDLAEQSLQALQKISREHPTACLRAGALIAVLSYLDFFSTGVQRVAVSTAANICRQLPTDAADLVMDAVPILTNLLQYQDAKVLEHVSMCLTRIAESFAASSEKLDTLCSHGLIQHAVRHLISVGSSSGSLVPQTSLSTSTYTRLIKLLSTCARGSAAAAERLLLIQISRILNEILVGVGFFSSTTVSPVPAVLNRPPEQLYEIVTLVNELLPQMPETNRISVASTYNGLSVSRIALRKYSEVLSSPPPCPRVKLLRDQPDLLVQFGINLFPVLVQVHGSSVNPPVRHKCLDAINKLLSFSTPDMLRSLLKESNISSFLVDVLATKDASLVIMALHIAEILMQKVHDVFSKMFVKEGVVHAIDVLIASESSIPSPPPPPGKSGDSSTGGANNGAHTPQRPQCGGSIQQQSTGNNDPATVVDPREFNTTPVPKLQSEREAAIAAAKQFKESYFSGDSGLVGVTESLCKLKTLCAKLNGECLEEVNEEGKGKWNGEGNGKGNGKGKAKWNGKGKAKWNGKGKGKWNGKGKGKWKGKGKANFSAKSPSEEELATLVSEILAELGGEDGVSTFEFLGSGVIGSLLNYFAVGKALKNDIQSNPNAAAVKIREEAKLQRVKKFIELSLPLVCLGKEAPLTILVRKLQNALASLEHFPVLSHTPQSSNGLKALTQPFFIRFSRASSEKVLRDHDSKILAIKPLATLVTVENFLWPRVKCQDSLQFDSTTVSTSGATQNSTASPAATPSTSAPAGVERRPCTRSRSEAAGVTTSGSKESQCVNLTLEKEKGKDKAVSKGAFDSRDEYVGPETRSAAAAARRKAEVVGASTPRQTIQGVAAPCGGKDGELGASPLEIEKAVATEDNDLSVEDDDDLSVEDNDDLSVVDDDENLDDGDHEMIYGEEPASVRSVGVGVHDLQLGDGLDVVTVASSSSPAVELTVSHSSGVRTGLAGRLGGKGSLLMGNDTATISGVLLGPKGYLSLAGVARAGGPASASGNGSRTGLCPSTRTTAISPPKLMLSLNGKPLNQSHTIFQAIQRQAVGHDGWKLWDEVYTITYQRADTSGDQTPVGLSSSSTSAPTTVNIGERGAVYSSRTENSWQQASLLDSILEWELPCDLEKTNSTYNILLLLRMLEGLNHLAPRLRSQRAADAFAEGNVETLDEWQLLGSLVPVEEFLSSKLTPKLDRQMEDALAVCGGLPAWCHQLIRACPFLFPFETRRQYFHSTAFGLPRALQNFRRRHGVDGPVSNNDRELRVGRLERQKVRVSRNRTLDSATKVMELYSGHKSVLEVEFFDEVGSGLGPTLEFYTLVSHDLQRSSLEMWRTDLSRADTLNDVHMPEAEGNIMNDSYSAVGVNNASIDSTSRNEDYVTAPQGMFPRPWPPGADTSLSGRRGKVNEHFRLLGWIVAKALQDGRMLDLPLSSAFYKLILGQELDFYDIMHIDPELGRTLQEMQVLVRRKQLLENAGSDNRQAVEALRLRVTKIDDLCLDFTLPGFPDYVLKAGGSDELVGIDNLEEYVSLVVDATVKTGVTTQVEAFRGGFNQVFQLSALQIFNEDELDSLLCGRRELWMPETLSDLLKFDHGYTSSSPPIKNLLELMGEFTSDQQRAFLRFVTGAPRLPPGGLSSLSPKLTVVRKHPTGISSAGSAGVPQLGSTLSSAASGFGATTQIGDGDLPSVMTCANYLKLPPYSCKDVMRDRLLYAIRDGQGSFDLS